MIKNKKIILYIKLFKFKLFYNDLNFFFTQFKILNFLKFFKIFLFLKSFGIFIPDIFKFKNNWIFSFWKKGFITNYLNLKWFFFQNTNIKKLPFILINLTAEKSISSEIKKKKYPLVHFSKINYNNCKKNTSDYFFSENYLIPNLDFYYFLILTFSYLKNYKNV